LVENDPTRTCGTRERCVDSRRDILQPIVVAFTQQLLEIECPLLPHRRALPLCLYTTHGLRWPFAAILVVVGFAWGQAMGRVRQRHVLSTVTLKRRKSWLLAASALASLSLGMSGPALALDECGPLVGGSVTCTSASNPYPAGITYGPPPANQTLHVTLDSDVNVTLASPGVGVALNNFGNSVPVLLEANGATINVTQVPALSGGNRGLYIETQANNATITASGQIDVAGEGGAPTQ
jgi:hypothetical protein